MLTAPNVLVVQVQRNPEGVEVAARGGTGASGSGDHVGAGGLVRHAVSVEDHLSLPGGVEMDLVGVVFHNGPTLHSGHYTCLCRGPQGRFWYFDDDFPVQKREEEVAHIKPREVYLIVYARQQQGWAAAEPAGAAVVDVADDGGVGGGGGCGGAVQREAVLGEAGGEAGGPSKRRLSRKSSSTAAGKRAVSPVVREATTPERQAKHRRLNASSPPDAVMDIPVSPHGPVESCTVVASPPPVRRLRRKTSLGDGSPCLASNAPPSPVARGAETLERLAKERRLNSRSPPGGVVDFVASPRGAV